MGVRSISEEASEETEEERDSEGRKGWEEMTASPGPPAGPPFSSWPECLTLLWARELTEKLLGVTAAGCWCALVTLTP